MAENPSDPAAGLPPGEHPALLDAVRQLLRPLARLAVARGLTHATVDEMLRAAFVEEAFAAYPQLLEHRRVSRISAATGINRREVTRLVEARQRRGDGVGQLLALRRAQPDLLILDVRTREEHEAVKLPNARLLTQELVQEIFTSGDKTKPIVLYDHTGSRSLDAAAYFIGHGFGETKCLDGGIDAYSTQVDASLPRYRLEIED